MALPLYRHSVGLNTVDDPVDVDYDPETGVIGMQACSNITHRGNKGRPGRRGGTRNLHTGDFHSMFCDGGDCFFIENRTADSVIMRLTSSGTISGIRSGLFLGRRMAWVQDGGKTYYSNGRNLGVIEEEKSSPWPDHTVKVGTRVEKTFQSAPAGDLLAIGHGRMWIVVRDMIYYSEPFAFGRFALGKNFIKRSSDVKMILIVAAGMYVSDSDKIVFYAGSNPAEMKPSTVAYYPAIPGTLTIKSIPSKEIGKDGIGDLFFVTTTEGLCSLSTLGVFQNEVKNKALYPDSGSFGSSLIRGYNIIHSME